MCAGDDAWPVLPWPVIDENDLELAGEHRRVRQLVALGQLGLHSFELGLQKGIHIRHLATVSRRRVS